MTVRRIRVRSSRQADFTRMAGALAESSRAELVAVAQAQAVAALFQQANWDWNDPLSAAAFEQWRDRQVHKTDEVATVSDPRNPSEQLTRIRTVSAGDHSDNHSNSEVEAASITIDTGDYEAVSERLEFRDGEWVELSEIAETSTESAGGSGAMPAEAPVRVAETPSRPAAFAPGSPASISDELQALSALSAIGADLGELQDVKLSDGKVLVTAPGSLPAARQDEIRASLASVPHVEVEFTPVPAIAIPATAAANASPAGIAVSPMEARLEKFFGGHAGYDRFSTQLLELDDAAMKQVFALHNLAKEFPPESEAHLSADDLKSLHELSRKHSAVLAGRVGEMEQILVPTLASLGGTAEGVPILGHAGWQLAARDVYGSAQRVERLIAQMLGMTQQAATSIDTLPSDLMKALHELRASLADCQQGLK